VYLNVRRSCGVSYCQERLWCILMSGEVVVYLNVRIGHGVSYVRRGYGVS
jgi:hypothetical protein